MRHPRVTLWPPPPGGVTQEEGWHFKYGKRHAALTQSLHTLPARHQTSLFPPRCYLGTTWKSLARYEDCASFFNFVFYSRRNHSSEIVPAHRLLLSYFYPLEKRVREKWEIFQHRLKETQLLDIRLIIFNLRRKLSPWVPKRPSKLIICPLSLWNSAFSSLLGYVGNFTLWLAAHTSERFPDQVKQCK